MAPAQGGARPPPPPLPADHPLSEGSEGTQKKKNFNKAPAKGESVPIGRDHAVKDR